MVLTKEELIGTLQNEVRILLHLISKVDESKLEYRPTAKQRSTLELLQYLTIVGPIHLSAIVSGKFDMDAWSNTWRTNQAAAKQHDLQQVKDEIGRLPALFADLLASCTDDDLRTKMEMFGSTASRGLWIVRLVLCHYSAYRMQLFLYLKASGGEELNTLNLWAGMDGRM